MYVIGLSQMSAKALKKSSSPRHGATAATIHRRSDATARDERDCDHLHAAAPDAGASVGQQGKEDAEAEYGAARSAEKGRENQAADDSDRERRPRGGWRGTHEVPPERDLDEAEEREPI